MHAGGKSMHMKTRATITLTPEVLQGTRRLARKRGTSVSSLIEDLLAREIAVDRSRVDALIGSGTLRTEAGDGRLRALVRKHVHA